MRIHVWRVVFVLLLVGGHSNGKDTPDQRHERAFWSFIDKLREASGGDSANRAAMEPVLSEASEAELTTFWVELPKRIERSYCWEVWAVGAIVDGHVHHDFLDSYQSWLIFQGKEFFEATIKNPAHAVERLPADTPSTDFPFDDYVSFVADACRERRVGDMVPYVEFLKSQPEEPGGERWRWQELSQMHPELWERYFEKRCRIPKKPDMETLDDSQVVSAAEGPAGDWVDIYSGPEYFLEQYKRLPAPVRCLHAVVWMSSEVANGGYDQFFHNSTGVVAPEALDGLRLFGAQQDYDELAKVMAAFPGGGPSRDQEMRLKQKAERWGANLIESEFPSPKWPRSRDLEAILARYIRAHPEDFFRSE